MTLVLGPDWGPFEGYRSTGQEEGAASFTADRQTDTQSPSSLAASH